MSEQGRIQWPEDLEPDSYCPLQPFLGKRMEDVPLKFLQWVHQRYSEETSNKTQSFWLVARYFKKHHLKPKS